MSSASADVATSKGLRDNILRIGDIVTLKYLKKQAYLSTEGVIVEDVYISPSIRMFEENLFQICAQRQYSAINELEDFNEKLQSLDNDKTDGTHDKDSAALNPGAAAHLEALLKGRDNETALNKSVMKSKTGNVLSLGDTIQLLHVKSLKYVTVRAKDLARDEKENMRVGLSSDGSVLSWLKVMPYYKINREGEQITNHMEILLQISEKSGEYLHCAERHPPKFKHREVNSSLDLPTPWKISLYQAAEDLSEANSSFLLAGQLVYIKDPEQGCAIAPIDRPITVERQARGFSSPSLFMKGMKSVTPLTKNNTPMRRSLSESAGASEGDEESIALYDKQFRLDEFIANQGEIVLKPVDDEIIDTSAIWMMESRQITKAGTITFKTDRVRFRHFNTGRYLVAKPSNEYGDRFIFSAELDPGENEALFSISLLYSTEEVLKNSKAIQLSHANSMAFVERGPFIDEYGVYTCPSNRDPFKAVSMILNRYAQIDTEAGGKKVDRKGEIVLDIYFGQAVFAQINHFVRSCVVPNLNTCDVVTIWPKLDQEDRTFFGSVVSRAILFLKGFPILLDPSITDMSKYRIDKRVVVRRQNMFREMGILQEVLIMLNILQPISAGFIADTAEDPTNPVTILLAESKVVLNQCLLLVFEILKENQRNQMYISDYLLVILAHISTNKMAASVARELLSSNRELQETKIGVKEITIFAEKMREIQMNSLYLELLQTCCSCMGEGVPRNQEIVNSVVFKKYSDVLITLESSAANASLPSNVRGETGTDVIHANWHKNTSSYRLYIEPYVNHANLRGAGLCIYGLPKLYLSWVGRKATRAGRYTKPIEKFFHKRRGSLNVPAPENPSFGLTDKFMTDVGEFFIGQLQLASEMCLGRNYPVMREMEASFPYESLITILKDVRSDRLKAAAANLILNLYIDRDPQTSIQLPRYTRTLSESLQGTGSGMVCVDENRVCEFGLLQSIISFHFMKLKGKPFAKHTGSFTNIMNKMVNFHFYGRMDRMIEVTELLVSSLQRGEFDIESSDERDGEMSVAMLSQLSSHKSSKSNMPKSKSRMSFSANHADRRETGRSVTVDDEGEEEDEEVEQVQEKDDSKRDFSDIFQSNAWAVALTIFESEFVQSIFLIVAFAAIGESIYLIVVKDNSFTWVLFNYAVYGFHVVMLIVHFFLHLLARKSLLSFFGNVFNLLDLVVLALFVLTYINIFNSYLLAISLRFLRLVPVEYMIQSAFYYILKALSWQSSDETVEYAEWVEADRYKKTSEYSLKTMVKMVQTLCNVQENIADYHMSLLLKAYARHGSQDEGALQKILEDVFSADENLQVSSVEKDYVYLDLLMYNHPPLVQATLQLLMTHHSSRRLLLSNVSKLQLITSEDGVKEYQKMESIITKLRRDADKHEIWGKLTTPEHREINAEMQKLLVVITEYCMKRRETLEFDEVFEPVKFSQNILRNLGCFELCLKLMSIMGSIDPNDKDSERHANTRQLVLLSNRLLYWFVLDNPSNQKRAFDELTFFIRTIDENIESHKVIIAIFRNNLKLMELVPKKHIGDFVTLICNNGRKPEYLALMSSIINVGEKNVIANQYEVIKLMSSPENVKKVALYFCAVNNPEYRKKIALMGEYLSVQDVSIEQLPAELAYHLELMALLSRCTIGVSGMTTIEAKVQSMFFFVDIIESLIDPQCLLLGKIRLGLFLFNSVVDVETTLPALKDADCFWKFIASTEEVFSFAKDELRQIEKNGWQASTSCRQKMEYMIVCAMLINGYFSSYYDPSIFKADIGQIMVGVKRVELKESQASELIKSIYLKIMLIYEMVSPLLTETHHKLLFQTLVTLNEKATVKFVAHVPNLHDRFLKSEEEYALEANRADADATFARFVSSLTGSKDIEEYAREQLENFVNTLESLPWRSAQSNSDIRFEPVFAKIVSHIRETIQVASQGDEIVKSISPEGTATAIWMLEIFRTMIEKRWGMTIFERDEDGGEEQDEAIADILGVYHSSGIAEMCLDLISRGIDEDLQLEAIKLLVGMLFKEGGALPIQKTIYAHLSQPGSDMFFKTVRSKIQGLISWHKWTGVVVLEEESEPDLPRDIILIRCLQLMCEGHFMPNQDLLRDQPNNLITVNLLEDLVQYLQALDPIKCKTSSAAEGAVCALVLEVLQGPCVGNQDYFALSTELLETINKKIRQRPVHDCDENEELELKKGYMEIMQGLLEGQGKKTAIFERVLSVIHIDVILVLCKENAEFDEDGNEKEESEESVNLRVESLVLLQMLVDFKPELRKELGIEDDMVEKTGANVACIEVVWRGELQRRFFLVPQICNALAKSTKDSFIMNVNRASPEDKLYGLLEASKDMYREITHQKFLNEFRVDKIFSRTNQDWSTWASLFVVLTINLLYLFYYTSKVVPCEEKYSDDAFTEYTYYGYSSTPGVNASSSNSTSLPPPTRCSVVVLDKEISEVTYILNFVLIGIAFFTLLIYFVVRVPVNYRTFVDSNMGVLLAAFYTAIDLQTLYYFLYLAIALIGIKYHAALSFLLLDFIAKSAGTRNLLRAIYNPRKQLFMTVLLIFVCIYIFAFFQFYFVNDSSQWSYQPDYITLMNSFKFLLRQGFPYASPENQMVFDLEDYRIINDILFFIMCSLMGNILKGITIDTFVELRSVLEVRTKDTTEKCFICGISKNTFNRTLDREAFRLHIRDDQNLWNYIYFIIFLWEQDKDDDDGLETYVRRCIAANDLSWFPVNKALRLSQHQAKGDATSLTYKFRKNLHTTVEMVQAKMKSFRDQLSLAIGRVEKSLNYEMDYQPIVPVINDRTPRSSGDDKSLASSKGHSKKTTPRQVDNESSQGHNIIRHPLERAHTTVNPLEADILKQMHLRVVFISGLNLDTKALEKIFTRVVSNLDQTLYQPVSTTSTSTLTHRLNLARKNTVRFDSATEESTLVWEGGLGNADLTQLFVRAQVLYGSTKNKTFIGGTKISIVDLLKIADSGGVLEIDFKQIQFERQDYGDNMDVVDVDADGKALVPETSDCVLGISAVASPQLLEEWTFRGSRPQSSKKAKK